MKVLLFSCLLGGACAFGANPELASEGAVAQGFGTPGAPSEGGGRETRFGGGSPGSAAPKFDPTIPSKDCWQQMVDAKSELACLRIFLRGTPPPCVSYMQYMRGIWDGNW